MLRCTTARQMASSLRRQRRTIVVISSAAPKPDTPSSRPPTTRCSSWMTPSAVAVAAATNPTTMMIQPIISPLLLPPQRHFHTSLPRFAEEKEDEQTPPAAAAAEATTQQEEDAAAAADSSTATPSKEYSTPELTADAAEHKAAMDDPDRPHWQNPLHHTNPPPLDKIFRQDFDTEEEFEQAVVPAPPLDNGDGSPPTPAYLEELADEIVHLTVLEMNELVNKMAEHYGFHEGMLSPEGGAGMAMDGGAEAGEGEEEAKEEKTAFDVKLTAFDAKAKIKIIKEVRSIAGLGLKEAKEWVEGVPKVILKDVKQEEANEIKAKLEELGGTVEIV